MRAPFTFVILLNLLYCFTFGQKPTGDILILKPGDLGYKENFFINIGKEVLDSVPSLGSFLVYRNNGLLYEKYYNGASDQTDFLVKSVTKTVVSALAGIAYDKKLLPDLNTPLCRIFPEYAVDYRRSKTIWFRNFISDTDSFKKLITVKDLLTMRSGYLWDEQNLLSLRAFHASSDPVRYVLDLPFEAAPGTMFRYCSGASHVFGAIVSKSVKQNLKTFADTFLFKPLGIYVSYWSSDILGRTAGHSELSMKARDMLKFGILYLNQGVYNGRQVLSKEWIAESTAGQAKLDKWDVLPDANGYGYYWWRRKCDGHQVYVASGTGGQLICIVPDLKMVVVTTCFMNDGNRGRSEIRRLHGIIEKVIREAN
jgi:CubicO group peptidase (beta-lactamase class C family)